MPATLFVVLSEAPSTNVIVHLTAPSGLALEPASVSFDTASWASPQTVTVTAANDANTNDEAFSLSLVVNGVEIATVPVAVRDNDDQRMPSVVVTPTRLALVEGGQATVQVHLTSPPTRAFRVAIATEDTSVAQNSTDGLTFAAFDWSTDQSITITAPEDPNTMLDTTSVKFSLDGQLTRLPVEVQDNDR